jgi:hypothetical protein
LGGPCAACPAAAAAAGDLDCLAAALLCMPAWRLQQVPGSSCRALSAKLTCRLACKLHSDNVSTRQGRHVVRILIRVDSGPGLVPAGVDHCAGQHCPAGCVRCGKQQKEGKLQQAHCPFTRDATAGYWVLMQLC